MVAGVKVQRWEVRGGRREVGGGKREVGCGKREVGVQPARVDPLHVILAIILTKLDVAEPTHPALVRS